MVAQHFCLPARKRRPRGEHFCLRASKLGRVRAQVWWPTVIVHVGRQVRGVGVDFWRWRVVVQASGWASSLFGNADMLLPRYLADARRRLAGRIGLALKTA